MTKLTEEQIESELTAIAARHSNDMPGRVLLREAFTLGKDHGEACIIERAAGLVAVDAEQEKQAGIGRAVMVLTMWVLLNPARGWNVNLDTSKPSIWLHAAPGEFLGSDICGPKGYHYEDGADLFEAFAKIEKWCTEHARTQPQTSPARDTEPAPAMTESEHVHRAAVAGVTIDQLITAPTAGDVYERMLKASAVVQTFDGSDDAPSTPRNL